MANEGMKTLDQKRASHAWDLVENEVGKLPESKRKEFGTQAKKLPMRILAAGLGQALAFLEAKDYAEALRKGLATWMQSRRPAPGEQRLVVRVIQGDADFLRFATAECLAYLQWVVRFADAQGLTDSTEQGLMARGKIKKWLTDKNIGWIIDEADNAEVFFGSRDLRGLTAAEIKVGLEVEFDRGANERGPTARNIRRAGAAATPDPTARPVGPAPVARPVAGTPGAIPLPPRDIPLPLSLRKLLEQVPPVLRHPGLQLDKYGVPVPDQQAQRDVLTEAIRATGDAELLKEVGRRRQELFRAEVDAKRAVAWSGNTVGPLTLHLARAAALENAGLCLHPIYGFAYLPGTGLKGMARAYAETVWMPSLPPEKQAEAWRTVEQVFGWAPGSDTVEKGAVKPWKPSGVAKHGKGEEAQAGAVVFHDAWPENWPRLVVDICNNHHDAYYQDTPPDAPGDWHGPVPVYFLAVAPGQTFTGYLGKRRSDVPDELLRHAEDWLRAALTHLGCGAKTAAGYGTLVPTAGPESVLPPARLRFTATLQLATPAFLAGAAQKAEDCTLRSATLRGLLRWWWRAMHVGYVDVPTLRRMEAALWGDTSAGGALRLEVRPLGKAAPVPYDKKVEVKKNDLPNTPDKKTTQGLWYHSYGMNDGGKQRLYVAPGNKWQLVLNARDGRFVRHDPRGNPVQGSERVIDKTLVLDQAQAALWWLCTLGGVGSKARKGFGNLLNPPELDPIHGARFVTKGKELRAACGLVEDGFKPGNADSPALRQMADLGRKVQPEGNGWVELRVDTDNVWQAIEAVGMAAQMFAKGYKHRREKCALGLPRRIGNPAQGQFRAGQGVGDRHSSPVHYHLHPDGQDFILRVAAFPATRLPNLKDSETMLAELLGHLAAYFGS